MKVAAKLAFTFVNDDKQALLNEDYLTLAPPGSVFPVLAFMSVLLIKSPLHVLIEPEAGSIVVTKPKALPL